MEVGIGLPTTVPEPSPDGLVEWAARAEHRGFSSLGVLDRLVYDNYESLLTLAAAAAVTSRIRLLTCLLLVPYRGSPALLAKQVATLDRLSGGRLTLGVGAGGRQDDFEATGATYHDRGPRLDDAVAQMRQLWSGPDSGIGPVPLKGTVPVLVGGHTPTAMRRAARIGDGWLAGGGTSSAFSGLAARMLSTWAEHGRAGRPRLAALVYVSLGPDGQDRAQRYLSRYYAFLGERHRHVVAGVLDSPQRLRRSVEEFALAGCDELMLLPCSPDPAEVDRIADAVTG